ncbi:hypothetical protein SDRG_16805 [Saprolegnia diclina VS20]|uniref:Uncharacterized protein n=1 Tax=Saprolegnia diclina (strain VS20) TaxID=1156394 RepID=T0R774_SAPDV|nr:hypothetical protein SDRG_16805 [Saprolegnia diclina VS20]EQC25342.1 hypothetical protein SDRG_16805 [Saprolegnia diclina VS20]|eukprot:XP_008621247.1 hypothetical protein SDRG_16805 [Saprolegnia diclina VS20]
MAATLLNTFRIPPIERGDHRFSTTQTQARMLHEDAAIFAYLASQRPVLQGFAAKEGPRPNEFHYPRQRWPPKDSPVKFTGCIRRSYQVFLSLRYNCTRRMADGQSRGPTGRTREQGDVPRLHGHARSAHQTLLRCIHQCFIGCLSGWIESKVKNRAAPITCSITDCDRATRPSHVAVVISPGLVEQFSLLVTVKVTHG